MDVLDTLGSSMTNLNAGSGFVSNMASRGNKISILAFEVANTIVKGSNLLQSISEENIQFLKKEILHSGGVQLLVSTDMTELLRIAAADKRLVILLCYWKPLLTVKVVIIIFFCSNNCLQGGIWCLF